MKPLEKKSSGRLLLYVLLLAAAIGIMYSLKHCRRWGSDEPEAAPGDTLRVAMQYAPGSFYLDENKELAGVDYEALKSLGLPYRIFLITDPAEGLRGLDEGRYDMVVGELPLTADIAEKYIATEPVYTDRQVLVQRIDSSDGAPAITSQLQLADRTVVVSKDSPMASRLHNLEREIGANINVVERDATSERLLTELALGVDSVPLVVANSSLAAEIARDYPDLDYSVPVSLTQFQPWILRADRTDLRDAINERLK